MNEEYFIEKLRKQGLDLTASQIEQFQKYASFLIDYNQKVNLTAIEEREEIYLKHFYDSLLVAFKYPIQGKACDVGSGAGFPGIPLKIVYPQLDLTIIEPNKKRIKFLEELTQRLEIKVRLISERAEDAVKDNRESFDVVFGRAVASLNILAELCIPLVKLDGVFIALKGSQGLLENKNAENAIKRLGCLPLDIEPQNLTCEIERYNLIYKKIEKTSLKYPRNYGQIKKKPL